MYDALAAGAVSAAALEARLAAQPLADGEPIYAVDASVWMRCDAATSPGRAIDDHPSRHSAGQPVVAGWAYHWIAPLNFARESWTAPLSVRRLRPQENSTSAAAEQMTAFRRHLPGEGPLPGFIFDADYDPVRLTQALGDPRAGILVRRRAGRCFSADPTSPPLTGRPRRPGPQFDCADSSTWRGPDAELTVEDEQ